MGDRHHPNIISLKQLLGDIGGAVGDDLYHHVLLKGI